MTFVVWGLGLRVWILGFTVDCLWFMVHGSWFLVHGSWFMVHGLWCMVHKLWCMVQFFYFWFRDHAAGYEEIFGGFASIFSLLYLCEPPHVSTVLTSVWPMDRLDSGHSRNPFEDRCVVGLTGVPRSEEAPPS